MRTTLLTALLLLSAYALFLKIGPTPVEARTQSFGQDNLVAMEHYFSLSRQPEVVLVGTSLGRKLDLRQDAPCTYNLAMGGGSVSTGLAAVAKGERKPRLLLVEINIPAGDVDQTLIDLAARPLLRVSAVFRTENMPANLAYSYVYQLKKDKADPPVVEAVFQNALALQRSTFSKSAAPDNLAIRMDQIRKRVQALEASGVRVIFFELPVNPELEQTPLAVQVRDAFKRTFPDNTLVGHEELSRGQLPHTVDGIHLDTREATAVAAGLRPYYEKACGSR
jgi:hypothetical protein